MMVLSLCDPKTCNLLTWRRSSLQDEKEHPYGTLTRDELCMEWEAVRITRPMTGGVVVTPKLCWGNFLRSLSPPWSKWVTPCKLKWSLGRTWRTMEKNSSRLYESLGHSRLYTSNSLSEWCWERSVRASSSWSPAAPLAALLAHWVGWPVRRSTGGRVEEGTGGVLEEWERGVGGE